MEINFFSNQNPIGYELSAMLKSGRFTQFKIAVAYAKTSGVGRLQNDLYHFVSNGGKVEAIVGIDQMNTSFQALVNLSTFTKGSLFIHHDKGLITFHPKIYLFGNEEIEYIFIGSSNLTGGGFYTNFEANVGITLNAEADSMDFRNKIQNYWNFLKQDANTKPADLAFLTRLLESGNVSDETVKKSFKEMLGKVSDLPFTSRKAIETPPPPPISVQSEVTLPPFRSHFVMTLSNFDVSNKSLDPIQLIPIAALKELALFWSFPNYYTESEKGYPQMYALADITLDSVKYPSQHIRLYYYEGKKEFRLQCELIKRKAAAGDLILIKKEAKKPMNFTMELHRVESLMYHSLKQHLVTKVSPQKSYGYF